MKILGKTCQSPSPRDIYQGLRLYFQNGINQKYYSRQPGHHLLKAIVFAYVWRTGGQTRKPFPGFNPLVYKNSLNLNPKFDPTLHFLKSGKPQGEWKKNVLDENFNDASTRETRSSVAVHIHAYYPEMLRKICDLINKNSTRCSIFITYPNEKEYEIISQLKNITQDITLIPLEANIGRDLGPFFTKLPTQFFHHDIVFHVHTKKSYWLNDTEVSEAWSNFCLGNMLGTTDHPRMLDKIVQRFEENNQLGMVFPDDPNIIGWDANFDMANTMNIIQGIPGKFEKFDFPVGSMFAARPGILEPVRTLDWGSFSFPPEPVPSDGTTLHALERILGLLPKAKKLEIEHANISNLSR